MNEKINYIESFFKNEAVIDFLKNYDALFLQKHAGCYINYFGLNFKDHNVTSVKFYAHTLDDLPYHSITKFLPTAENYLFWLPYKKQIKHFAAANIGTALEIKFKTDEENPVKGFFLNTDNEAQQLPFSLKLPSLLQKNAISTGVNFEYASKLLYKKYYFFNQQDCVRYFSNTFNLPCINNAHLVEYAESENFTKINVNLGSDTFLFDNMDMFTDEEKGIIYYINNKYALTNMATFGVYNDNQTKSIYFFDAENCFYHKNKNEFEYYINTIQKMVNKV